MRIFSFRLIWRFQRMNQGNTARTKSAEAEATIFPVSNPSSSCECWYCVLPPTVKERDVKPSVDIQQVPSTVGSQTCATGSQRMKSNRAQKKQGTATATTKKRRVHLCHGIIVIRRRKVATEALLVAMPTMQKLKKCFCLAIYLYEKMNQKQTEWAYV